MTLSVMPWAVALLLAMISAGAILVAIQRTKTRIRALKGLRLQQASGDAEAVAGVRASPAPARSDSLRLVLADRLAALVAPIQDTNTEILRRAEAEIAALTDAKRLLQERLDAADEQWRGRADTVAQLSAENAELESQKNQARAEIADLKGRLAAADEQMRAHIEAATRLSAENAELDSGRKQAEAENARQKEQAESEIASLTELNRRLEDRLAAADEQLLGQSDEMAKLAADRADLQRRLAQADGEIATFAALNQRLEDRLAAADEQLLGQNGEMAKLAADSADLQRRLRQAQDEIVAGKEAQRLLGIVQATADERLRADEQAGKAHASATALHQTMIESLERQAAVIAEQLERNHAHHRAATERAERLETRLAEIETARAAENAAQHERLTQWHRMETAVNERSQRITDLQDRVGDLQQRLLQREERIAQLDGEAQSLRIAQSQWESMRAVDAERSGRLTELQSALTELQSRLATQQLLFEHTETEAQGLRSALVEEQMARASAMAEIVREKAVADDLQRWVVAHRAEIHDAKTQTHNAEALKLRQSLAAKLFANSET